MPVPAYSFKYGFTLVELLVVITISSMAVALVGGLGVSEYKKYQVKAEQLELVSFLNQTSHKAFIHEQTMVLHFKNNDIQVESAEKKKLNSIHFNHISFADFTISLNRQGFYSKEQLQYQSHNRVRNVTLKGNHL